MKPFRDLIKDLNFEIAKVLEQKNVSIVSRPPFPCDHVNGRGCGNETIVYYMNLSAILRSDWLSVM